MNQARRKTLASIEADIVAALGTLEDAKSELADVRDEEQESFDNLSEGLQQSQNGQRMEEVVGFLEEAIDAIDTFVDSGIQDNLSEAMG